MVKPRGMEVSESSQIFFYSCVDEDCGGKGQSNIAQEMKCPRCKELMAITSQAATGTRKFMGLNNAQPPVTPKPIPDGFEPIGAEDGDE
jgi:hypothetical protein